MDLPDRLAGTLLGTALGRVGFVSDDTEQSALVAQSLARHPSDPDACVRAFRRSLLGWFLRLPWGIGLGTLRACARIAVGLRRSGVATAGNGAAMRAAIVGVFFLDGPFGPTHLRALAADLAGARLGRTTVAEYRPVYALARNLALYPVVLAYAARRIIPY